MIVYNVTVNIEEASRAEWLDWMQRKHIPEVMATGHFIGHRILKLLTEEENGGTTYAIQYYLKTLTDLDAYQEKHAPRLQADHHNRFPDKFVAFRTVLEVVE